jgi:predicted TPR repeat methyltransferase
MQHPVLNYPLRSPLKVAETIKDIIRDKIVCDVGCACGDLMFEFSKYCKKVIGIEYDKERVEIARKRGLEVVDKLPDADVYYIWIGIDSSSDSVMNQLKSKKGTLILAEEDIRDEWGGYKINIPIDDISMIDHNNRKIWHLQVVEL